MKNEMKAELISCGVDVEASLKRYKYEERYMKYLKLHVEQDNFERLKEAVAARNVRQSFMLSHTLKSDFDGFSFTSIAYEMSEICETLRSGSFEGVEKELSDIDKTYDRIVRIIKKYTQ